MRILILCLLLAGCATTPEYIDECGRLFTITEEVEKCEERVLTKERRQFERHERELKRAACLAPMIWDQRGLGEGKCVDGGVIIL
jgi:hypothetical protein